MLNNITVIIRAVDERTIEACSAIVLNEVCKENVFLIKEKPFSEAVKKTFEIGLQQGKKWTLAIDADLILMPNAISIMIGSAEKHPDNLYVYQGFILDKFKCGLRQGGPHLYLTKNLNDAVFMIGNIQNNLRPESSLYLKMKEKGYNVVIEKKIYALHDFFQYYKDVYTKAYFHGIKHRGWRYLQPLWMRKSDTDDDYKVSTIGFIDGYFSNKQKYPTSEDLDLKIKDRILNSLDLKEKPILNHIEKKLIENVITDYNISYNDELEFGINKKSILVRFYKRLSRKLGKFISFGNIKLISHVFKTK